MKRFVICLDGTWQQLRPGKLTNIGVIASSVAHETDPPAGANVVPGAKIPQVVIYSQGVGATTDALGSKGFFNNFNKSVNRFLGGALGEGVEDSIVDTYLRLAFNYEAGDEIYIFGFSRGAFAARSLSGLINCAGIISRMHVDKAWEAFQLYRRQPGENASEEDKRAYAEECRQFRLDHGKGARNPDGTRVKTDTIPEITYLGIFDTVVQRGFFSVVGLQARYLNKAYGFHNLRICPNVKAARHAVAIDERRHSFPLRPWEHLDEANQRAGRVAFEQRWFVGTHGDIGGGEGSLLSAGPLKWVAEGAANAGLRFYGTYGTDQSPLYAAVAAAGMSFEAPISRPNFFRSLAPLNWNGPSRRIWMRKDAAPAKTDLESQLDLSAVLRSECARVRPRYLPEPLKPFRPLLRDLAAAHLAADQLWQERKKRFLFF